jgi:hypothetical protein
MAGQPRSSPQRTHGRGRISFTGSESRLPCGALPELHIHPVRQRVLTAGGCSDPAFWEMVALDYARSGREGDLAQAIAACEEGTRQRPAETTASSWRSLCQTAEIMRLRLARAQRGHEVRHHPGPAARRKRGLRFA